MQYFKAYFFTAVFTATCLFAARAQEIENTKESPIPIREIGFGTNIILSPIFSSGSAPLDLMYRWGKDKRLYRVGTSLMYNTSTNYFGNLDQNRQDNSFKANVFLGKEWRAAVANRWLVNFGGDMVFNSSGNNSRNESTYEDNDETTRTIVHKNKNMRFGGGLRPFVGVMFKINDRLLLGTEASFLASLQNFNYSSESYTLINNVRDDSYNNSNREESGLDFNIRTQPASNIFVYYRF